MNTSLALYFAVWNGVLLYSELINSFSLVPGTEISEEGYRKLMQLVEICKERLKEINERKR